MPAQWTGILIGELHNIGSSVCELAEEAKLNKRYVSTVLNSESPSKKTEEKLKEALKRIKERYGINEQT